MNVSIESVESMKEFGKQLGQVLKGGEVIELIGDIGAGKTTLTKGIALGLGIDDDVQSPTFTISRVYDARDGLRLVHYDFYRLTDPGVLKMEVQEAANDPENIMVVEWGGIIEGILPNDRLTLTINVLSDTARSLTVVAGGERSRQALEAAR